MRSHTYTDTYTDSYVYIYIYNYIYIYCTYKLYTMYVESNISVRVRIHIPHIITTHLATCGLEHNHHVQDGHLAYVGLMERSNVQLNALAAPCTAP